MTTEQYSIGYEEGYQDGWNAAMDAKPASKPLTDEHIREGGRKTDPNGEDLCHWSFKQGVRFTEAAHGIKENT